MFKFFKPQSILDGNLSIPDYVVKRTEIEIKILDTDYLLSVTSQDKTVTFIKTVTPKTVRNLSEQFPPGPGLRSRSFLSFLGFFQRKPRENPFYCKECIFCRVLPER